ncbi:MAG: alpha/beta fold hydrolase [Agrococcus casei]|uniref:alpha/beta fold hydrolase n=1 Tax=Agrococcus casei TaxID=343512 RepID=UPI003F8F218C
MDIILIPGLWLDAGVWSDVLEPIRASGHTPHAVSLPGQGGEPLNATLDDQINAVAATVDAADGPALVVGHSAASTLAWLAADRRPDAVARVVMIGGMPAQNGSQYAGFFEPEGNLIPFPGWQEFEGPNSDDLSEEQKTAFEHAAIPVPSTVSHATVTYQDERRRTVPITMICPEYSPADVEEWRAAGQIPELDGLEIELIDIDSGHWPMFTKPAALAGALAAIADRS